MVHDLSAGGAGGGSGLTEVIWRSQGGKDTGEELQTDLHLRTVTVSAETRGTCHQDLRTAEIHAISIHHRGFVPRGILFLGAEG